MAELSGEMAAELHFELKSTVKVGVNNLKIIMF